MLWSFLCLVTAIFPLLSVDKVESLLFMWITYAYFWHLSTHWNCRMSGGYLIMVCGWFASGYFSEASNAKDNVLEIFHLIQVSRCLQHLAQCQLTNWQIVLIMLTVLITGQSVRSLRAKEGLPLLNQITGWVLLGTPVLLTLNQRSLLTRLYFLQSFLHSFHSSQIGNSRRPILNFSCIF